MYKDHHHPRVPCLMVFQGCLSFEDLMLLLLMLSLIDQQVRLCKLVNHCLTLFLIQGFFLSYFHVLVLLLCFNVL